MKKSIITTISVAIILAGFYAMAETRVVSHDVTDSLTQPMLNSTTTNVGTLTVWTEIITPVMNATTTVTDKATTTDTFYVGAGRIPAFDEKCFTMASTTFNGFDNIPIWTPNEPITITDAYCTVIGATSVAVIIEDTSDNGLESITCDTDGQADDGSITNGSFEAQELMRVDLGTVTDTPDWLNYCITYTYN